MKSTSLFRRSSARCSTVREDRVGRQCRLGPTRPTLDRLAAHHRWHPRGHFAGRVLSDTPKIPATLKDDNEPEAGLVLGPGTRPSSTAMPATACTAMTSAARRSRRPDDKVAPGTRRCWSGRKAPNSASARKRSKTHKLGRCFCARFRPNCVVGDAGTMASRPSRRVGWMNQYIPWLSFDLTLPTRAPHRFRSRG
jgi:hypothetical protein